MEDTQQPDFGDMTLDEAMRGNATKAMNALLLMSTMKQDKLVEMFVQIGVADSAIVVRDFLAVSDFINTVALVAASIHGDAVKKELEIATKRRAELQVAYREIDAVAEALRTQGH